MTRPSASGTGSRATASPCSQVRPQRMWRAADVNRCCCRTLARDSACCQQGARHLVAMCRLPRCSAAPLPTTPQPPPLPLLRRPQPLRDVRAVPPQGGPGGISLPGPDGEWPLALGGAVLIGTGWGCTESCRVGVSLPGPGGGLAAGGNIGHCAVVSAGPKRAWHGQGGRLPCSHSAGAARSPAHAALALTPSFQQICPSQVRVWDIGGLRKKTVAPGGGGGGPDDMLRLPQVSATVFL